MNFNTTGNEFIYNTLLTHGFDCFPQKKMYVEYEEAGSNQSSTWTVEHLLNVLKQDDIKVLLTYAI